MTCEKIQERFADYLTGDLDEASREEVQGHIAVCTGCRAELEDLTAVWAKLGVLPEEQPTSHLRGRFYAMLEDAKKEVAASGASGPRRLLFASSKEWFTFRRPSFAAAFSVFVLLLGLGTGWVLNGSHGGAGRLTALQNEVQDMRQTVALSLLDRPSASERLRGISYSSEVRHPAGKTLAALIDTLDNDQNTNVRLAAIEALYLFRNEPGVKESLVHSLGVQDAPLVQVGLIDLLVEIKERRAADALKALIAGKLINADVKKRAEQGLKQII